MSASGEGPSAARQRLLGARAGAPVVFVAIPTGQVVANLLPLFELAGPDDHVLWLATPEAEGQGWLARSRAGLAARWPTIRQHEIRDLAETFDAWQDRVAPVGEIVARSPPVYLLNGGTKLMNFAVAELFRQAGLEKVPVAYAATSPTHQLVLQPEGPGGPTHRIDYGGARSPRLDELLAANGHAIFADNRARCLWRTGAPLHAPEPMTYATDGEETLRIHQEIHRWVHRERRAPADPPAWAAAALDATARARLRAAVAEFHRSNGGDNAPGPLYDRFRRVMLDARDAQRRAAEAALTAPPELEPGRIGDLFEGAVAARTLALLRDRPELAGRFAEVWTKVSLRNARDVGGDHAAEADLILVTRHATALIIECKSGLATYGRQPDGAAREALVKDLHARAHRLQRAVGTFAKVVVCLPLFCDPGEAGWQDDTLERWRQALHGRHETLFLTLPGHRTLTITGTGDQPVEVGPFEHQLARLLARA